MPPSKELASILESIGEGNLSEVYESIESLECTYDVRMRIIDSFNRRLKRLSGATLPSKEKGFAEKLVYFLTGEDVSNLQATALPFMVQFSSVYRHMLIKERCLLLEVGERLLYLDEISAPVVRDPQTVSLLHNNFYAFSWNYLRENHQNLKAEENLQVVSQSLRWLVRQGVKNFSSISHKLQQMSHILTGCGTYAPVSKLITDIYLEQEMFWLKDVALGSWKQDPLKLDGFFMLLISSIQYAASFLEFEAAEKSSTAIVNIFAPYFDSDLVDIIESVIKYFYSFLGTVGKRRVGDGDTVKVKDLTVLTAQLTKFIEPCKAPGLRQTLAFGFLQGTCNYLQIMLKDTRNCWTLPSESKDFECLVSSVLKLTHLMRSSPTHVDMSHLNKKRKELESSSLLLILHLISDYISSRKEATFTMTMVVEQCFEGLKRLVLSEHIAKETMIDIYTKLNYHGGQIGTNLIRLKEYQGGINILLLTIEVAEKLLEIEAVDITKVDPTHSGMVLADAYNQMKEFDLGLKFLAEMLVKYPFFMDASRHTACVDVLEPISWYNWNYQWVSMKRNAAAGNCKELMGRTTVDYVLPDKKFKPALLKNGDKLLLKMLYFEFNSYFTTKSVIPDGLIKVGETLQLHGKSLIDQAVGLLAQAIGFWWGDVQQINDSIELCRDASAVLEKEIMKHADDPVIKLLASIIHAWYGLANMRKFQEKAVIELEIQKNDDLARNPKKYLDSERTTSRVIPAISSVNMGDEALVASHFVKAIDMLYDLLSLQDGNESNLKQWIERIGSGVVVATLRLMTDLTNALGMKLHNFKCCCVARAVAQLYNRTYLNMLVTSELIKLCPSSKKELMIPIAKMKDTVDSRKVLTVSRNPGLYFMRATLANAIACIQTKEYGEAISSLAEIFQYRLTSDVFDVGHHVLGEAYFVLAELRMLELECALSLSPIPKYLKYLTPVGLVSKGFKILASVSRTPNPTESGWNDLFHNYSVLATIMEVSDKAIAQYCLCGKLREARCIAADFIYLAQQMAFVSRTINLVVPLAEMDVTSGNFDSCQQKVECVINMLRGNFHGEGDSTVPVKLLQKLRMKSEEFKTIVENDNETWHVTPVSLPEHNYGQYGPPPAYLNDSPTVPEPRKMRRVMYLHHSMQCMCYICTHPQIIPSVLRFYCLQARLASCSKCILESGKILEAANRYHLKAMLRILCNVNNMKTSLTYYLSDSLAVETLDLIYRGFFSQPGMCSQITKMEIMPAMDLKESIPSFNQVMEGLKLQDSNFNAQSAVPLETLTAAIFKCIFLQSDSQIKRTSLREFIENDQEDENTANSISPDQARTPPLRLCKPPPRKGLHKKYDSSDSDDENQPEKEHFTTRIRKFHIPFKLEDDGEEVEAQPKTDTKSGSGPSRNTRSRTTSTDKT